MTNNVPTPINMRSCSTMFDYIIKFKMCERTCFLDMALSNMDNIQVQKTLFQELICTLQPTHVQTYTKV